MTKELTSLDKKDTAILAELELDSKQSYASIAKKVHLSKQTIRNRVNAMVRKGIITHYMTLVDTQKLGYTFYNALFQFRATPEKEQEILTYMHALPEVCWLVSTIGTWNALAAFLVKDVQNFHAALQKILDKYRENINQKELYIVINAHPCLKKYLHPTNENTTYYLGERKQTTLSQLDVRILKKIDQKPRMTSLELAQALEVSYETVKRHIEQMKESGVIRAFTIKTNPAMYGYEWHIVLLHTEPMTKQEQNQFVNYLKQHPAVVFATQTVGATDFTIDLHVKNQVEANKVINQLKERYPIKKAELLMITKEHKVTFVPPTLHA